MSFWTTTYYGQSPGDLENKNNGFAGNFVGYNLLLKHPKDKIKSNLPTVLIMGDSIINNYCIHYIRAGLSGIANVNVLGHPHHCKNIKSWLDDWEVEKWDYDIIFYFDGMHGFPPRVTEEEHQKLTPIVINRLYKATKCLIWGNCTPIPDNMPQGKKNSVKGPNSKDQILINESAVERNKSILKITTEHNIHLIDLYSETRPFQSQIQYHLDLHFNQRGQQIIANAIISGIKIKLIK
jgi:hypothetical protein